MNTPKKIPFICSVDNFDEIIPFINQPNTLVLCDIDDTVLMPADNHLYENLIPTDKSGFLKMYHHIYSQNIRGTLMFLTARSYTSDAITREDLALLEIPEKKENLDIHYTNNIISKGEYIHRYLGSNNISNRQVIFIDDRMDFIRSVINVLPDAKCFLFCRPYK